MAATTTPVEISEAIIKFCAQIDPTQTPAFIRPKPDPKAVLHECYANVRRKIKNHGGSMQLGWLIWETPGIMLEGMSHAVWRSPQDELVDVTPQMDGEAQLLFLPDSSATIQNEYGNVIASRRMPLVDDPVVHEFIRLSEEKDALFAKTQGTVFKDKVQAIEIKKAHVLRKLALKYPGKVPDVRFVPSSSRKPVAKGVGEDGRPKKVGRNDPCPCGSGKKYKKCHGIG